MKRLLCSLLLLAVAGSAFAAPSVTGVSGTVSNGESITITGTDFGATGPTVVLFDDFEKGTNGNIISTSAGSAQVEEWSAVESAPDNPAYSSAFAHSGSLAMLSDQASSDGGHWSAVSFTASTRVFVSFWVYLGSSDEVPGTGEGGGPNWKLGDVNAGSNASPSSQYTVAVTLSDLPPGGAFQSPGAWYGASGLTDGGYCETTWVKGRWHRFDAYYIGSTGTSGADYVWEIDSATAYNNIWSQTGMTNLQSADSDGWQLFRLHSYARQDSNGKCYYDDVYVATGTGALARVEICNNATYTSATNCAIATPTSWGATSITATVRQGSFGASDTAYLFVIDSSGVASAGHEVTFGSGGETPVPRKLNNVTGVRVTLH